MHIKITEKCSMGCTHCLNNAKETGNHMEYGTFLDALDFQKKYGGSTLLLTGGEPSEHPNFMYFLEEVYSSLKDTFITVATNGLWMQDNFEYVSRYNIEQKNGNTIMFQVTSDDRFYPVKIKTELPVYSLKNVIVCNKVERIYPQGRALINNLQWNAKASKCVNIRLLVKQMNTNSLSLLINYMNSRGFFCTPHIDIYGNIKLGESDLCPICSNIYRAEKDIINDINNFKCSQCDIVNRQLSEQVIRILGGNI